MAQRCGRTSTGVAGGGCVACGRLLCDAAAALNCLRMFEKLLGDGKLESGTRFMCASTTRFAPMMSFIEPGSLEAIEPLDGAARRRELNGGLAAVPADQLAIQWDAALEFAVLEGVFPAPVGDFEALVSRMVEIASWVQIGRAHV